MTVRMRDKEGRYVKNHPTSNGENKRRWYK
jgi:hypothetical protein